jgi:hypothetical protein
MYETITSDKPHLTTRDSVHASFDIARSEILCDVVKDGFATFNINNGLIVKSFAVPALRVRRPRNAIYGTQSDTIVTGSDHGTVYVFGRSNGRLRTQIRHSYQGAVQTIAVSSLHEGRPCAQIGTRM